MLQVRNPAAGIFAVALSPLLRWALIGFGACVALYGLAVLLLFLVGRRSQALALARFVPDCLVLFRRLLRDPRVPRTRKVFVALLLVYLALPVDLIPDFIPVVGQLDDAILAALVLRGLLRTAGRAVIEEHWPGPPESLRVLLKLAGA